VLETALGKGAELALDIGDFFDEFRVESVHI
jgi:hypothetical protein